MDEHSYRPSGWIRTNFDYFDKYPRKPWKIYVGEYAHHHDSGDWSAAMDDSVYLMMLERNGDLVKMASYAPLFANLNQRELGREPDRIRFLAEFCPRIVLRAEDVQREPA